MVLNGNQCFVIAGFDNPNARNETSIRCLELIERTGCKLVGMARSSEGTDCLVQSSNPETVSEVRKHSLEVFGNGVQVRFRP